MQTLPKPNITDFCQTLYRLYLLPEREFFVVRKGLIHWYCRYIDLAWKGRSR